MKSTSLILLFVFIILNVSTYSQNFYKIHSLDDDVNVTDCIEINNEKYLICGTIGNYSTNEYQGCLILIDKNGEILDFLTFNRIKYFSKILKVNTNFFIFGSINSEFIGDKTLSIVEIDEDLNEITRKEYGDFNDYRDEITNVVIDFENNITTIGSSFSTTQQNASNILMYKFNLLGDSLSSKMFEKSSMQLGFDLLPTSFGYKCFVHGYIVQDIPKLGTDIINMDYDFHIINTTFVDSFPVDSYLGNTFHYNIKAKWLNDSSYIAAGRVMNTEYLMQSANNMKGTGLLYFSENDSILNAKIFGKIDTSEMVALRPMDCLYENNIFTIGTSNYNDPLFPSFSNQKTFFHINKVDNSGQIMWSQFFGNSNFYAKSVTATSDSGAVVIGSHYDFNTKNGIEERDFFVIKVNKFGEYIVNYTNNLSLDLLMIKLFPNPTYNKVILEVETNKQELLQLNVYDLNGKIVHQSPPVYTHSGKNSVSVNLEHLVQGMYILEIELDNNVYHKKINVLNN
jgi:hypothetical protein